MLSRIMEPQKIQKLNLRQARSGRNRSTFGYNPVNVEKERKRLQTALPKYEKEKGEYIEALSSLGEGYDTEKERKEFEASAEAVMPGADMYGFGGAVREQREDIRKYRGAIEQDVSKQVSQFDLESRYAVGDPNVTIFDQETGTFYLEDTGERYNNETVYRSSKGVLWIGRPSEVYFASRQKSFMIGKMVKDGNVFELMPHSSGSFRGILGVTRGVYAPTSRVDTTDKMGSFYDWKTRRIKEPYKRRYSNKNRRYDNVDLNKSKKQFISDWKKAQSSGKWGDVEKNYGVSVRQRDRFTSGKRAYDIMAGKYNAPKRDEKTGLLSVGNFIDPFTGLGRNPTNRLKGIDIFQEANYDKKKRTHTFINPFNLR